MKISNGGVSEIISTLLLLAIVATVFSTFYIFILSAPPPKVSPIVNIASKLEDNDIILEHRGGEPLSLDTKITMIIGGKIENLKIGDFMDEESKEDNAWSLGERVVYPISFDFDYEKNGQAEFVVSDVENNVVIMTGYYKLWPECDISIEVMVDNYYPEMGTQIVITIIVKNNSDINASGMEVSFKLPKALIHDNNATTHGSYNNYTGLWSNIGLINPGKSAFLNVTATVGDRGRTEPTQLVMILDGSASISKSDWKLQLDGLSAAVADNDTIPDDGSVEISIVQFGGSMGFFSVPGSRIEIDPIIINESNSATIANDIKNINQLKGYTPTACGILLATDTVVSSSYFNETIRQVAMLVTDGQANMGCTIDGDYDANFGSNAKSTAEAARDYLVSTLELTDNQDEFDSLAVGKSGVEADWLKDKIVWPEPGYYAPPFIIGVPNRGWVRNVSTWQEFADSINESFGIIFNKISVKVNATSKVFIDPKTVNNVVELIIIPQKS